MLFEQVFELLSFDHFLLKQDEGDLRERLPPARQYRYSSLVGLDQDRTHLGIDGARGLPLYSFSRPMPGMFRNGEPPRS